MIQQQEETLQKWECLKVKATADVKLTHHFIERTSYLQSNMVAVVRWPGENTFSQHGGMMIVWLCDGLVTFSGCTLLLSLWELWP